MLLFWTAVIWSKWRDAAHFIFVPLSVVVGRIGCSSVQKVVVFLHLNDWEKDSREREVCLRSDVQKPNVRVMELDI